jgi:hypothetical protein
MRWHLCWLAAISCKRCWATLWVRLGLVFGTYLQLKQKLEDYLDECSFRLSQDPPLEIERKRVSSPEGSNVHLRGYYHIL